MDNIYKTLYDLFIEELESLETGHPYNKHRVSYMRAIVTTLLYMRYAVLDDLEILKIIQSYEHI